METEPGASPNCASIAAVAGRDEPVEPFGARARGDHEVGRPGCGTGLGDPAGRVEGAAHVEAVGPVDAGRGEVGPDPRPHVTLAVLVGGVAAVVVRGEPAQQAADQDHDLPVGLVVGAGEGLLDELVPPLRPVTHPAVVQQVFLELGEAGPQVTDLHADRVTVQVLLLPQRRNRRVLPLEDVIGGPVDQHQLDAGCLQGVRDSLVFGRGLGDRGDDAERRRLLGEDGELGREGLQRDGQPAVAQLGQERAEVLAQLQIDRPWAAWPAAGGPWPARRPASDGRPGRSPAARSAPGRRRRPGRTGSRAAPRTPGKVAAAPSSWSRSASKGALSAHDRVAIASRPPSRKPVHSPPALVAARLDHAVPGTC